MSLLKQLNCKHEHILQGPQLHDPSVYGETLGDDKGILRVCKDCGFAERGWRHFILEKDEAVTSATEEECKSFRVGPEHHSSLFDWYYPEDRRDSFVHAIRKAFR